MAGWRPEWEKHLVVHRLRSLQALPLVSPCDVVLADGDHNWYTVYHELKLLEGQNRAADRAFPLVLLHDTEWPYGRRDLYYDPDSIPVDYRHSYECKGMVPGMSDLQEKGGLNPAYCNARHEGGPRNGVLTAVEDFLGSTTLTLKFISIPGSFGLGILFPSEIAGEGELGRFLQTLELPLHLRRYVSELQAAGVTSLLRLEEARDQLRQLLRRKRHGARAGPEGPA
jgi:hypothetical protein